MSWHHIHPEEQYYFYAEENEDFIRLANVIHEQRGLTDDMKELMKDIREEKKNATSCDIGIMSLSLKKLMSEKYENISKEAIYVDEISEGSLDTAADFYFGIVFCPDYDPQSVQFYQSLFENFSLETVLKTLARILLVSGEKKLYHHYNAVKTLYDRTAASVKLMYKDVALLTTSQSQLKLYKELKNHQAEGKTGNGKEFFLKINFFILISFRPLC